MTTPAEKRDSVGMFLEQYLQPDTEYRAGATYQAYLDEYGDSCPLSRKDFEMLLREQVIKDNGLLKRVSHGVYQMRTDPYDRGMSFTRGSQKTDLWDMPDELITQHLPSEDEGISLDEILDDSLKLTAKIKAVCERLNHQPDISFPAQMEFGRLRASLLKNMDAAVTGVTAVMAWCEDNIVEDMQSETDTEQIGGMQL